MLAPPRDQTASDVCMQLVCCVCCLRCVCLVIDELEGSLVFSGDGGGLYAGGPVEVFV